MYTIMQNIKEKACKLGKKILFFEIEDKRILEAVNMICKLGVDVILVGDREKIINNFKLHNIKFSDKIKMIEISDELISELSERLYELRKDKGLTLEQAKELVKQREYFSVMLVKENYADCMIGGSVTATGKILKPALQILREKGKTVSSFFSMIFKDKTYLFADCAMNINPDSEQLASIAMNTADAAKMFNLKPKIAMLSFSTNGSSNHEFVAKIREATAIVKNKCPHLIIEGEIQADAAIVKDVAKIKNANSEIKGDANILIFPDLNSGNISYKLVQHLAGCKAIGPIILGFEKPVNDLSRGCVVEDIVDLAMITILQCEK